MHGPWVWCLVRELRPHMPWCVCVCVCEGAGWKGKALMAELKLTFTEHLHGLPPSLHSPPWRWVPHSPISRRPNETHRWEGMLGHSRVWNRKPGRHSTQVAVPPALPLALDLSLKSCLLLSENRLVPFALEHGIGQPARGCQTYMNLTPGDQQSTSDISSWQIPILCSVVFLN